MPDLRFGTFLAPNMLPVYEAIADVIGSHLGMTTELVVETDYENCRNDINDVCFVCSLPYVMFTAHRPCLLVGPVLPAGQKWRAVIEQVDM